MHFFYIFFAYLKKCAFNMCTFVTWKKKSGVPCCIAFGVRLGCNGRSARLSVFVFGAIPNTIRNTYTKATPTTR